MIAVDFGWCVLWRCHNRLDGKQEWLIRRDGKPVFFMTRKKAREFIKSEYGWMRKRRDLLSEPHGWKMPIEIRTTVKYVKNPELLRPQGQKP